MPAPCRRRIQDRSSAIRQWRRSLKELGGIDVLVNNAAFQIHTSRFEDLTAAHFDETLKTNLYGYSWLKPSRNR